MTFSISVARQHGIVQLLATRVSRHYPPVYSEGQPRRYCLSLSRGHVRNTHQSCYKLQFHFPAFLTPYPLNTAAASPSIQKLMLFLSYNYEYFSDVHRSAKAVFLLRE
jgi:hypothetical protein